MASRRVALRYVVRTGTLTANHVSPIDERRKKSGRAAMKKDDDYERAEVGGSNSFSSSETEGAFDTMRRLLINLR